MLAAPAELVDGLGHELFARAGLAVHEHRRRGGRRLLDDAVHRTQGGRVADHLAEAAVVQELPAQACHIAERVLAVGDVREQRAKPLGSNGFVR